jgi:hypothetical protein
MPLIGAVTGARRRSKIIGKREEGRGKREEGRGKREEGRGKREEISFLFLFF